MTKYKLKFRTVPLGSWVQPVIVFFAMACIVTVNSFSIGRLMNSISNYQDQEQASSSSKVKSLSGSTGEVVKKSGEFSNRALWVHKGKFVFPAGTTIVLTPQITIPAFRKRPFNKGLQSDIQLSLPLYLTLDKMGFTNDMHPFPFDMPPFWPFGPMRRPIDSDSYPNMNTSTTARPDNTSSSTTHKPNPMMMMQGQGQWAFSEANGGEDYKVKGGSDSKIYYTYLPLRNRPISGSGGGNNYNFKKGGRDQIRNKRSIMALPPAESLHGGDRALIFPKIEEMLGNVGFEGRGCMLRVICEVHEFPLQEGYGLFGDLIAWFFTISQSVYAESHMPQYLKAEEAGRGGNCEEYKKVCSKSLFKWGMEKRVDHNEL
ncbi:unnamed protein product [Orchesella dallaii]|uniref:Uncharacterized protein n=1 Tax=Orchesella dallaii TaxID=48710 RepID=A0ABP1PQ97_9HEXA